MQLKCLKVLLWVILGSFLFLNGFSFFSGPDDSDDELKIKAIVKKHAGKIYFSYKTFKNSDKIGNYQKETPDGVKNVFMKVKLLKDYRSDSSDHYLLGYLYFMELFPQETKTIFYDNGTSSDIASYEIDFIFYFLDKDGYCLLEVDSEGLSKQKAPNNDSLCLVEKAWLKKNKCPHSYEQNLILDKYISREVARRTKKIVYYPKFRSGIISVAE